MRLACVALAGPASEGSIAPKFKVDVAVLKVHFFVTEAFTVSVFESTALANPEAQAKAAIAIALKESELSFIVGCGAAAMGCE